MIASRKTSGTSIKSQRVRNAIPLNIAAALISQQGFKKVTLRLLLPKVGVASRQHLRINDPVPSISSFFERTTLGIRFSQNGYSKRLEYESKRVAEEPGPIHTCGHT